MRKAILTLLICLAASWAFADGIFFEGFEYANHDLEVPIGWACDDNSWLCGYQPKDHNRIPHAGNWYAFTDTDDSWMFMELFMGHELKYRYYFWAISDGEYDVEIWAGNGPSADQMTQLLLTKTVNSGEYQRFAEYVQTILTDYQYFVIHAIAHEGAYCLTIYDIEIDMVSKYQFMSTPSNADTVLCPGDQVLFHFDVQDLGYEPIDVIISPIPNDNFSDFAFFVEGSQCTVFHLEPDEIKTVTMTANLSPTVQPGTLCWIDIMLVLDCNCATSMSTLWVTVVEPAGTAELEDPEEIMQVEVFDLTGKKVDPANLKAGVYIERTVTSKGVTTKKFVKQ